jgi:hypothetical protein
MEQPVPYFHPFPALQHAKKPGLLETGLVVYD